MVKCVRLVKVASNEPSAIRSSKSPVQWVPMNVPKAFTKPVSARWVGLGGCGG